MGTICVTLSDTGWIAGVGAKRGADVREVDEHSDLVVIWGGNPVNTQVNVMTHAMKAKKRGARIVRRRSLPHRYGRAADVHLAVRPGTDGALAVGVMHVLFKEGYADWDYLRKYTDAPDEAGRPRRDAHAGMASKITGLSVDEIVAFARMYGQAKAAFIRCHHGFSRSRNGAHNMHAVTCLPAVTGAWKAKGGGALYGHTGMYPISKKLIEGQDMIDLSIRELDQSRLGPILTGDAAALKNGPPVTGMLDPEHQPGDGLPGAREGPCRLQARGPVRLRARAVPDRDGGLCRHRAARHHVPRARRLLHRERSHLLPGNQGGDRAAGRVPREPLRDLRAGQAFGRQASRLRHDAVGDHGRGARDLGHVGRRDQLAQGRPGLPSRLRDVAFLDGFAWPDKKFRFKPDWKAYGERGAEMPCCPTIST